MGLWDPGNGHGFSQFGNTGMLLETDPSRPVRRYRCNDNHPEVTFSHLVFTLEVLPQPE